VKIGVLAGADTVGVVAEALARVPEVPVVLDPVLRATRGVPLFHAEAAELAPLYRRAAVITPNVDELCALSGIEVTDAAALRTAAVRLRSQGARAVLAKGGHLPGDMVCDLLVDEAGELRLIDGRIRLEETGAPRGTGCALSSELACELAQGATVREAATRATRAVREAIRGARRVGHGRPFLG
jgi:hydroxymethylpyrimidine/phosphomethylpyrimidine kinase